MGLVNFQSLDIETSLAKINFLNSIIADMQQKNDALKAKVQTLETLPMDFTKWVKFFFISVEAFSFINVYNIFKTSCLRCPDKAETGSQTFLRHLRWVWSARYGGLSNPG